MFHTPGAQLRSIYLPTESSRNDQSYLQYIQLLKSKGISINNKLFPSLFKLKNGLEYPGIATKQQIHENQILVRVPRKLVLSSFIALQRQQLRQIFDQDFYHDQCWQDRILNTYLLYIYGQKQQQNIWYHMVKHLSKDIDILGFWSQQDLNKFKDLTVKSAAQQDKQSFQQQWKQFEKVQIKYKILQNPVFNKENYQWIFIHITSRCFGKSLEFTSMAPFCQFVNHHCCNGHYDIENIKEQDKQQQIQFKQTKQDKQNIDNDTISNITSQGSYQSQDYIQIGQFAYDQIQSIPFKWTCTQSYDLNNKQKHSIQQLKNKNISILQKQLKWDDFTILFVPYIIEMSNLIENQYIAGRKPFQKAYNDLKLLENCIQFYLSKIKQSYKTWRNKDYNLLVHPVQVKKVQKLQKRIQFPLQQKNKYTNFILTTGKNDSYKTNNQVYFCYGRNSNRTLLLRYGFALQGNKYEHVWLSFEIIDILKQFPDTLKKLQQKSLSLRRKFKIKYGRLDMELIMFFRLNSWQFYGIKSVQQLFNVKQYFKQIAILNQIKDSLEFKLQQFVCEVEEEIQEQSKELLQVKGQTNQQLQAQTANQQVLAQNTNKQLQAQNTNKQVQANKQSYAQTQKQVQASIKNNGQFQNNRLFQTQYNLSDKKLSYHEYFITVYHQQKVKIIKQHIQFIEDLIEFNQQLQNAKSIQNAKSSLFTAKQLYTYRHYLKQYCN